MRKEPKRGEKRRYQRVGMGRSRIMKKKLTKRKTKGQGGRRVSVGKGVKETAKRG